jgi:hypothetical protein
MTSSFHRRSEFCPKVAAANALAEGTDMIVDDLPEGAIDAVLDACNELVGTWDECKTCPDREECLKKSGLGNS